MKTVLKIFCIAMGLIFLSAPVMAAKGDLRPVKKYKSHAPMKITLGKAELVTLQGGVSDILVADPSVVDVQAIQSNRLYVVGLSVGDTNVIALDAQGNMLRRIDVHVSYDLQAIGSLVRRLYPSENVKVSSIHDQILLTGTVSTPEVAARVADIVASYVGDLQDETGTVDELISNLLDVRGEQQVMLQVKIIEATRTVLKELGLETNANNPTTPNSTGSFSGVFQTGAGIALGGDPTGVASLLYNTGIAGLGTVGLVLNALEEENLVNVLAEPNLTAVSGQQAGFLAGGEFPVPVGRDQVGNIVIEFREFGVSLNFKPVVMSDKRISLQLNTEVSSLDFDNAIVLSDLTVPGLDIRRADTTVEIPSGGSLMIAGLLQSQAVEGMAGLPGISKAPVIGDLVASDSFQRDETELVVIVTSYLVEPYADENKAEHVPQEKQDGPLSIAFKANIRRVYGGGVEKVFAGYGPFGYVLN